MRAAAWLVLLAACDPIWGVGARVRDPSDRPVENATVAVACEGPVYAQGAVARTLGDGAVRVGGMGHVFPPGCDVYVAKPGYRTQWIRYRDLCPQGPSGCERYFEFDLVLEPETRTAIEHPTAVEREYAAPPTKRAY